MINSSNLTVTLARQVAALVDDLRERADEIPEIRNRIAEQWGSAVDSGRTDRELSAWREDLLVQVAASWVLGCVFVRFCEDNDLLPEPMLSGPGDRRRWAREAQVSFFRSEPAAGERRYLQHVFTCAAHSNGLSGIFGEHNPVWQFDPSDDACRSLIDLWRETKPDTGELIWDFTDSGLDTRFLGDLYQDLSPYARKTYALLQTPAFVESFLLDRTLDPAIEEFGLNGHDDTGFRMIDPACGSGHFLLGAFQRLAKRHLERHPEDGRRSAAARALESIYGVDINPHAIAIARFRLLVAALCFAQIRSLAEAPVFTIHVAVGDSLLHGPPPGQLVGIRHAAERQAEQTRHLYETEDAVTVRDILAQKYHAVVANPPYITPKDPAANRAYRERYGTCRGKYSLAVPFMELLFDLAHRGLPSAAGYVGQITANSFMKREFGKKLISDFLASTIDLTHVIDTAAVYVPGHGTPTVLLIGRNRGPVADQVRAVLGIRGESSTPQDPERGKVWLSILAVIDTPGEENVYVSSADIDRDTLKKHPWILQGGAAIPLREAIEKSSACQLEDVAQELGIVAVLGTDDALILDEEVRSRSGLESTKPLVVGDSIRDYRFTTLSSVFFPYSTSLDLVAEDDLAVSDRQWVWPNRTELGNYLWFGKTKWELEVPWYSWGFLSHSKFASERALAFAFVETHNHFVLNRDCIIFKQSAPVLTLPAEASEQDCLELLGILNSSIACFWMKQVFHNKGAGGGMSRAEKWHDFYEFDSTKLAQFPLALGCASRWARELDCLGIELGRDLPDSLVREAIPTEIALRDAKVRVESIRGRMVWLQEELDWHCMFLYGITSEDLSFAPEEVLELAKGQRAFEIALARQMNKGEVETSWFERHDSLPQIDLPRSWPEAYRRRVEQRLELIQSDRFVALLERPEHKRRWAWEPWEKLVKIALRSRLLTCLEDATLWPRPVPRSVAQLADAVRADDGFLSLARLYTGGSELDLVALVAELTGSHCVPYLAPLRYKESGMRKRVAWEHCWELQRREDAGEEVGSISAPPKYASSDFRSPSFWRLRGKLDVAKERFISYPGLERATDPTPLLGWAGWNHLEQAQALTALKLQREQTEGWDAQRLRPVLAGLDELVPWLQQWHNDYDSALGHRLGDYYADYLVSECNRLGLSVEELRGWRPPKKRRGRRKKAVV